MVKTRELLLEYMKYRLENAGFKVTKHENGSVRRLFEEVETLARSKTTKELIKLGKYIDDDSTNKIFMERSVRILGLDHPKARACYFGWLNELFKDKIITWGRLALVLVFTARLAEKAMKENLCMRVRHMTDWCCQYFEYNMFEEWLSISGGWERLPPMQCTKKAGLLQQIPNGETLGYNALALLITLSFGILMMR